MDNLGFLIYVPVCEMSDSSLNSYFFKNTIFQANKKQIYKQLKNNYSLENIIQDDVFFTANQLYKACLFVKIKKLDSLIGPSVFVTRLSFDRSLMVNRISLDSDDLQEIYNLYDKHHGQVIVRIKKLCDTIF